MDFVRGCADTTKGFSDSRKGSKEAKRGSGDARGGSMNSKIVRANREGVVEMPSWVPVFRGPQKEFSEMPEEVPGYRKGFDRIWNRLCACRKGFCRLRNPRMPNRLPRTSEEFLLNRGMLEMLPRSLEGLAWIPQGAPETLDGAQRTLECIFETCEGAPWTPKRGSQDSSTDPTDAGNGTPGAGRGCGDPKRGFGRQTGFHGVRKGLKASGRGSRES